MFKILGKYGYLLIQFSLYSGIQGKVVHLVVRPPPTTREQSSSGTATTDSTANMGGSGLGGFTFGGISMQQAIQDITSGILSGVSELSRATKYAFI